MFPKNRNKIKLNHILLAVLPGLIVAGFWGFASSNPKTIFDGSLSGVMVIDANDTQKRTIITAEPLWQCGDNVTFDYRGEEVIYGTIHNSTTEVCWLDRNLGAEQVATNATDTLAYGDLFQWGRCDDGHQDRDSATTTGPVNTYACDNGNAWDGKFILVNSFPWDWPSPQENNLWQGDGGINDPCPDGWRVPTEEEWEVEVASWDTDISDRRVRAYDSIKLTAGGDRSAGSGSLRYVGTYGSYWSSTVSSISAYFLDFYSDGVSVWLSDRAIGLSVRCLRD